MKTKISKKECGCLAAPHTTHGLSSVFTLKTSICPWNLRSSEIDPPAKMVTHPCAGALLSLDPLRSCPLTLLLVQQISTTSRKYSSKVSFSNTQLQGHCEA